MKKILAITLTVFLFATSGIAYAAGIGKLAGAGDRSSRQQVSVEWHQKKAELQQRAAEIKQNHTDFKTLREEVRGKIAQVKEKVRALKKNPDSLTEEKIAEISEKLSLIRSDKVELAGTWGLIKEEGLKLRLNKCNRNFEASMGNMDNIIKVQSSRMETLKKVSADLDALLVEL